MSTLIISGIVLTFLLLSVMLGKKGKLHADKYLIIYLFFCVVRQIYLYIEAQGLLNESYWMLFGKSHYLLNAPIFFFYVYALTQQQKLSRKWYALIFLPFVAYVLNFIYYYGWVFKDAEISFSNGLLYLNSELSLTWAFFVFLFIVIEPFYLILFYVLLKRYRKSIKDSLSFTDKINLNWLSVIFNIWFISAVVLMPVSVLTVSGVLPLSVELMQVLLEISNVAFFFVLGYYGFKQTAVFSNLELKMPEETRVVSSKYERSGLSDEQATHFHKQLLTVMMEKKPYLNGELSANELAQQLSISVNHLSQVLNTIQHQNFFDFVNGYRVQEVIEKMKDPNNHRLTLLAIALDSGFNSKTSFNTIFKKVTHQTPSLYFKSVSEKNTIKTA